MHLRATRSGLAIALSLFTLASSVGAATFDVIWGDRISVTTYPGNSGFNLYGQDIALVVNKGSTDMGDSEFYGAELTGTSTNPVIAVFPYIMNPGPPIPPVHPNEATGSVTFTNGVLLTMLKPGETFHNTLPLISLEVHYPSGFTGSTTLDLTIVIGGDIAHYSIQMTFTAGADLAIHFDSAARTSAVPLPTPAQRTSWNELKKLYR